MNYRSGWATSPVLPRKVHTRTISLHFSIFIPLYLSLSIYIGIVRNQTLGKRSTKRILGGGNVPLGAPSRVQLQMLDFTGFCWIVPLKGFFFLQNLAKNTGFSRVFLQTLSKNAGFARFSAWSIQKCWIFLGFFSAEGPSKNAGCLRERRAA